MSGFTPTTDQVRDAYRFDPEGEYRDPIAAPYRANEAGREFDRWLAEREQQIRERVAAEAWDEGHRAGWTEAEEDAAEAESLGARRWEERAKYGESAWAVPNPYRARTPKGHLT